MIVSGAGCERKRAIRHPVMRSTHCQSTMRCSAFIDERRRQSYYVGSAYHAPQDPSTQALVCFEAAARHESYTRAAQELALTQSAVSRQITRAGRLPRHGAVPPHAPRRGADAGRRRLCAPDRTAARQRWSATRSTRWRARARAARSQLAAVPTFATRWLIPRLPDFAATASGHHGAHRDAHPALPVRRARRSMPRSTPARRRRSANWAGTQSHRCCCTRTWCRSAARRLLAARQAADAGRDRAAAAAAAEHAARRLAPVVRRAAASMRRGRAAGRATSCSRCWRPPRRTAWAWRLMPTHADRGRTGARRAGRGLRPAACAASAATSW